MEGEIDRLFIADIGQETRILGQSAIDIRAGFRFSWKIGS
jgi:hypothetical protein